jgi:voltage-dependent calcium channel
VYENFSYVYQRAGKLSLFSREETRRFKKVWAKFDKYGSGHIRKDQVPRFLSQLRGIFEVRIYDEYHSVPTILQQCRREADPSKIHLGGAHRDVSDIDVRLLRNSIDRLPVEEIRERRRNFNILYEEVMISADHRGISFTRMLLMLAHYKFIDDNKALRFIFPRI